MSRWLQSENVIIIHKTLYFRKDSYHWVWGERRFVKLLVNISVSLRSRIRNSQIYQTQSTPSCNTEFK